MVITENFAWAAAGRDALDVQGVLDTNGRRPWNRDQDGGGGMDVFNVPVGHLHQRGSIPVEDRRAGKVGGIQRDGHFAIAPGVP
jgi:hypothetical protein